MEKVMKVNPDHGSSSSMLTDCSTTTPGIKKKWTFFMDDDPAIKP